MQANEYAGVVVHAGLEGIRHERSMYAGSTGIWSDKHAPRALNQLAQEIISNASDEFTLHYGNQIIATIYEDNAFSVQDFGRGMPKGPGESFDEVIKSATVPHASGKFSGSKGYNVAGVAGMHGIGLKVTNAMSRYVYIHATAFSSTANSEGEPKLDGGREEYRIKFKQQEILEKELIGKWSRDEIIDPSQDSSLDLNEFIIKATGEKKTTGTLIKFLPDDGPVSEDNDERVLESISWVTQDLLPRFESNAFLNAGLELSLTDLRGEEVQEWRYLYPDGMIGYLNSIDESYTRLEGLTAENRFVIDDVTIDSNGNEFTISSATDFSTDVQQVMMSYANSVPTAEGGPHVDGFNSAFVRAINEYAKNNLGINQPFVKSDVCGGTVTVFSIKIPTKLAEFEGQTKEKLGTASARKATSDVVYPMMLNWLSDNADVAEIIISYAENARNARTNSTTKRKSITLSKKDAAILNLTNASKLKPASSNDPELSELYTVEGDSASNIGQNRAFQAVYPMRGKLANVADLSESEVIDKEELLGLIIATGCGYGSSFDITKSKYARYIIAADADDDGSHITCLTLTFYYMGMRPLIEAGMVYVVKPPLYRAVKYVRGEPVIEQFTSEADIAVNRQRLMDEGFDIERYKGLGEMEEDESSMALANPETRILARVTIDDAEQAAKQFEQLMSAAGRPYRREWLLNIADAHRLALDL